MNGMADAMLGLVFVIVLIAYVYALTHWKVVNRPNVFLVGLVGLLAVLAGKVFYIFTANAHNWQLVIDRIFSTFGLLVAFWGFAMSCFGDKLPLEKAFGFDLRGHDEAPADAGESQ
jgi:hypothetical protein